MKILSYFFNAPLFSWLKISFNTNALFAQASLDVGEDSVIKIASRYTDYSNYFDHSFNRSLEYSHKFGPNHSSIIFAKSSFGSTTPEINAVMDISEDINYLNNNKFDNEVVGIDVYGENFVSKDEGPRQPDLDKMKSLNPAFLENGTITAATSSPVSIGAAAILLSSEQFAKDNGISFRAKINGRSIAGVDWRKMGTGPIPATKSVLGKAHMEMSDIDVIELNEAFAAQALFVINSSKWDMSKININGGAIALGHPLGCSGARIIMTLINVMEQQKAATGLATMCIGSGQGIATIIERA